MVYRVKYIACGQARRTEPSTLQFTEHLARVFFIDKNDLYLKFHTPCHNIWEVNDFESSVVVQELEFAINVALSSLL